MNLVLIAEDDPDIAALIAEGIADRLYVATQVVPNGALVPDAIAARRPELIVLDVSLPGLSGLDVFDLVRNDPGYRGIPVLFLTASPERAAGAFASGGEQRVMAKPFDLDQLVTVVDQMLDGRAVETAA